MILTQRRNDRVAKRVKNNLGIVRYSEHKSKTDKDGYAYRDPEHEKLDQYYENTQHDHKPEWDQSCESQDYIQVRKRQPRIQYPFAKVLASRVVGKLIGKNSFPKFKLQDDPDTEEYIRWILKTSHLRSRLIEPSRRMCITGSSFVHFGIVDGAWTFGHYLSKYCYPVFAANGQLEHMTVAYVFEDPSETDLKGKPKKLWFREDYGMETNIRYDNPEVKEGQSWQDVSFQVVEEVEHGLGFVQGEWFRTYEMSKEIDGPSFIADILDFMNELDYNLSQSSTAIQYNQDPQLLFKGLTEDDIEALIRSSTKGWNLGKDGEASYLETGLNSVQVAQEFRDSIRLSVQDIARIVLMDPEKMATHAQSGKALEILHGPMIELIDELRPAYEKPLVSLVTKMAVANLKVAKSGNPSPVTVPPKYEPKSLSFDVYWPEYFQKTLEDLRTKVQVAASAGGASLVSRETLTRWLAKDFDIDDVEAELQRIATQPTLNPFGGGFF